MIIKVNPELQFNILEKEKFRWQKCINTKKSN